MMSYDLRRLRLHGIIERIEATHRYRLTAAGMKTAFSTRDSISERYGPLLQPPRQKPSATSHPANPSQAPAPNR